MSPRPCPLPRMVAITTMSLDSNHHLLLSSFGEEHPEENRVHLGHAIMSFYAALIDLLGRCAPETHVSPGWEGARCGGRELGVHDQPSTSAFRHWTASVWLSWVWSWAVMLGIHSRPRHPQVPIPWSPPSRGKRQDMKKQRTHSRSRGILQRE